METTTLGRPGRERGLGRYALACLAAAKTLDYGVRECRLGERAGRMAEFADIIDRTVRLLPKQADIFHCTYPGGWAAYRHKTVTSILDVIPMDLRVHRKTGIKSRIVLNLAARSDAILTLSEFSATRIVARLGVDASRIVVAPLPPEPIFRDPPQLPRPVHLQHPFVLCLVDLATPDPRKRAGWVGPLADGLNRVGLKLVVVGAGTAHGESDNGRAVGLGRLPDRDFAALLPHAVCFAYFSAMEGQGLPPLEAMATGTAVVAASNSAVTEVVGGAGLLIEERSSSWEQRITDDVAAKQMRDDFVEACAVVAGDAALRRELQLRGKKRAQEFSDARFTRGVERAYEIATCA
jgi:glycosyltransferase involved in cell wall biosynthesis